MKPSKLNRTPLFVGLGVAAVAVAGGAFWLQKDAAGASRKQAQVAADVPVAPKGRLQLLRKGVAESRYLALDEVRRTDAGVEVRVLVIGRSVTGLEGGTALMSQRKTIDCARRRVFDGVIGFFDVDGRLVSSKTLHSGRLGRLPESDEVETGVICDGAKPDTGQVFPGFRAAQREAQALPDGYEKVAAARPEDPDAWAWLCTAGARGRWRDTTASDCDRAVKLNPASAAIRLDRAFLSLTTGKQAVAQADFASVLGQEPGNAAALFGRGLLSALRGDQAASRRDRGKALDLDPLIPVWIQSTYGVRIGPEYMTR